MIRRRTLFATPLALFAQSSDYELHNALLEPAELNGKAGQRMTVKRPAGAQDCFYVRPTNGRAEDQERRNHSMQSISHSHPDFTWDRLRKEFPSKYESYADKEPAKWVRLRVEVNKEKARRFVNRAQ